MIRLEIPIDVPENCDRCPLADSEYAFCHGRYPRHSDWEIWDDNEDQKKRPKWCPIIIEENS